MAAAVALGGLATRDPMLEVRAALPALRRLARQEQAAFYRRVIGRIERDTAPTAHLPIPADGPAASAERLPIPAQSPPPDPDSLPIPALLPTGRRYPKRSSTGLAAPPASDVPGTAARQRGAPVTAPLAVDFGTTNSVVAVAEGGGVRVLHLPGLAREQPAEQSPLVPSAVHVAEAVRRWLVFRRRTARVCVGQQALNQNYGDNAMQARCFVQGFKPLLGSQPHRPLIRGAASDLSARDVSFLFLRGLLASVRAQHRLRADDLTVPVPVGSYETYRAELRAVAKRLGVRRFRTLDEPVAAAIGYGVSVAREETLLVVDFGGGTLDLAAVRLGPDAAETGGAPVLAKHMVALGGDDVDGWLLAHFLGDPPDVPEWRYDARWEAMRVKEQVGREGQAGFRWHGVRRDIDRGKFIDLLTRRGLYERLGEALAEIGRQLAEGGHKSPDEVLLVGGSTLLPGVAARVDRAFPDAVVRHDPDTVFTAVAVGAAHFAGGVPIDDFTYHDYGLAVQNGDTRTVEYELLVPRRTRYPTAPDLAVRYYADYPGMTDIGFHVSEVGRLGQSPVPWLTRGNGSFYWTPGCEAERACLVSLNPSDAPLPLRPAGTGTSPRLRVTYGVNADRWLCVTVEDLVRRQHCGRQSRWCDFGEAGEPVVARVGERGCCWDFRFVVVMFGATRSARTAAYRSSASAQIAARRSALRS